jgi:hypothetical protein
MEANMVIAKAMMGREMTHAITMLFVLPARPLLPRALLVVVPCGNAKPLLHDVWLLLLLMTPRRFCILVVVASFANYIYGIFNE